MSLTVPGGELRAVAYSPDGSAIAVGAEDGRARVYDTATHTLRYETAAADSHTKAIKDITFSGDGTLLATASGDKEVRIWNAQSGELNQPLPGHTDEVYGIAFAPASKNPPGMLLLASAGLDGRIIIWDVAGGFALREIRWSTPVHDVAFSPDGSFMATGAQDNLVVLWDTAPGDVEQWVPLYRLPGHTGWVRKVEFSPDGRTLASSSWDNTARLWDTVAGRTIQSLAGSKGWVYGLAFAPDGRSLVTSSIDGYGRIWNVANEQDLMIERAYGVSNDVRIHSLAYSGDGRYLATGGFDNTARLWDAATHEPLRPFLHYDVVYDVSLSADGSRLLTASADRSAIVWDTATGEPVVEFLRHNTTINSGVISR
ncbi:MAG: WD40 repeat domain-containing protein, partial [Caldilinea sp.]|nr:WD40 repeat domain-containing protein [Caldilinea sp.]